MKGILQEATGQIDNNSAFYDDLLATNILDNVMKNFSAE